MSKTVQTKKGTHLPLTNLKGKDYLMVAYRLQWLTEDVESYEISTELTQVTDDQTVARATVTIYGKDGKVVKRAQATKRETKKDFPDHTEKAETAAIGRALAMLGFGTQHAISDLDEGQRIVDSPVVSTPKAEVPKTALPTAATKANNAAKAEVAHAAVTAAQAQASVTPDKAPAATKPSSFKSAKAVETPKAEAKPAAASNLDW